MSAETSTGSRSVLADLSLRLAALKESDGSIEEFSRWFFIKSLWESRVTSDTLLDLGANIESTLYQWQDFPNLVTKEEVGEAIENALKEIDHASLTMTSRMPKMNETIGAGTFLRISLPGASAPQSFPVEPVTGLLVFGTRLPTTRVHLR